MPPIDPELVPHPDPELVPHPDPELVPHPDPELVPHPDPELVPHPDPELVPHIDAELVRALVAREFPHWAELAITPSARQGNDNRTFRLGAQLAVRLPSAAPYAAGVLKEDRALPRLRPHVQLRLPEVVATAGPSELFPLPWSVRTWLSGDVPADAARLDRRRIAEQLGEFLSELRRVPAGGGPAAGRHSFFRGCHPSVYADEVQAALQELGDRVDQVACRRIWSAALTSAWPSEPVWVHGDVAPDNLLVEDGSLSAVIDFGTCLTAGA